MGVVMLFACIFVPYFAVQASLRLEPEAKRTAWSRRPVAVFDGPDTLPRVVACNEAASLEGIEVGCTKAQVAQCPGILLRKRDPKQEQSAQDALVDCALAFSPRVESTLQGVVSLDIAGTEKIFGPPQTLVRALAGSAAKIGLEVNVAAASNPDTTLLAAKGFQGTCVVAKGNEADALAQLPIDVLPVSATQAEILDSWGIRRCRDLVLLPPVPLVERLGQPGLHLQNLASGRTARTLIPVDPPLRFEESLEFDDPVVDLDSLLFVINRLLEQISSRLVSRSLATDGLHLNLGLEVHPDRDVRSELQPAPPKTFERVLRLPVPMQDTKVLLKLLQLDLSQHGPGAAVKCASVEARPAKQRHTQGGLFAPLAPEAEKLEVTLARIRGVVGESDGDGRGRIGSAEVLDSNRPDAFRISGFTVHDPKTATKNADRCVSVGMSFFRPPLAAEVRCHGARPIHISFAELESPVLCAAGPWLTSGNWWKRDDEWRREEWDIAVQLPAGVGLYRIFRDLLRNAWFVEGLYD
jgi:protein ImuB